MPLTPYHKFLVIRTDRIGDVILTSPVFKALRTAYPSARIAVLVTPTTIDLVKGNPYIDEVMVDDRKGRHGGVLGALTLARDIRRRCFDTVFIMHTKRRYNLTCFLAGIPKRIGFKNDKFGFLLTHPVFDERARGEKHEAQYCIDLLRSVGIEHAALDLFVPKQKEAEDWAMDWLRDNHITPGELVAVHPSASDQTRLWPAHHFAQLIDALTSRYPFKVVLIGSKDCSVCAHGIKAKSHAAFLDLTGQTTVAQMASLLRLSRLLISNDSGPVHVGAGVGINVISLFLRNQPGINPKRWRPLGPRSHILTNKPGEEIGLDNRNAVVSGKPDSITVEEVLGLVERIVSGDNQRLFYW